MKNKEKTLLSFKEAVIRTMIRRNGDEQPEAYRLAKQHETLVREGLKGANQIINVVASVIAGTQKPENN